MPIIPAQDLLRINFQQGARTPRPLAPPGNDVDGRPRGEHDITAKFPSEKQVTTITLGTSTATDDVTTLVATPTVTSTGSAWAQELAPVTIKFTTGATQTLAAVAAGLEAAAAASQLIANPADIANFQRIRDFLTVTSDGDDVILTSAHAGGRFTYVLTSTGALTESSVTIGDTDPVLEVGTIVVETAVNDRGYKTAAAPVASSTADKILGVVMDSLDALPLNPAQDFKLIPQGKDPVIRGEGSMTVYAEAACSPADSVYVRKVKIAGQHSAVTGTATTDTIEVITITPNPVANATLYRMSIKALDFFTGAVLGEAIVEMTSDADATATEIVTGLTASLALQPKVDDLTTATGTDTMILTQGANVVLEISVNTGNLDPVIAPAAASDHMLWPNAEFIDTAPSGGGTQAIHVQGPTR